MNIQKKCGNTVKGRTEKPLLRATPVRENPKSTPKLKPPRHEGSRFRRMAFGGIRSSHGTETDADAPLNSVLRGIEIELLFGM